MKGEVGEVHLRIAGPLQMGKPGDQMVPHRNGHVLEPERSAQCLTVVPVSVQPLQTLDIRTGRRQHRARHRLVHVDPNGPKEISIEKFVPVPGLAVAEFGIEHLGELISHVLILGVHELRDENPREKPRKVIKLDREFLEVPI